MVASTMVVNVASRRVMENAGLKFVRNFHQPWPDYIEGDVEYALLRSEWEPPTSEGAAVGPVRFCGVGAGRRAVASHLRIEERELEAGGLN